MVPAVRLAVALVLVQGLAAVAAVVVAAAVATVVAAGRGIFEEPLNLEVAAMVPVRVAQSLEAKVVTRIYCASCHREKVVREGFEA